MKIALLCNHPFAFPSIEGLASSGVLCGIATPQNDGITESVKLMANQAFVPFSIIQKDEKNSLQKWIDNIEPDFVFVMGFPYKISQDIIDGPGIPFYNFHTGILPFYRGIDPVFWQIKNQEPLGGITVHRMNNHFDSGSIALEKKTKMLPYETYGLHLQRLSMVAKEAALEMIAMIKSKDLPLNEQENYKPLYLKRPKFNDLLIHWNKEPAAKICALARAANPAYGGAGTFFYNTLLRITQIHEYINITVDKNPGTIVFKDGFLLVVCADKKLVAIDIVYIDAGLFTGEMLIPILGIKEGDFFLNRPYSLNQK
jgi:methionyl-tRNA formyltransferase